MHCAIASWWQRAERAQVAATALALVPVKAAAAAD
jgi:hypothetical protein